MKITPKKTSDLNSSGCQTQKSFVIGDAAIIIDILRSRLYSHPLRTSIQEYISNARDANREANSQEALVITLPNKLEPVFKVRDHGLGLSPKRVEEVFVKYGVSTKRADNKQTGGFGIGAKSAWAYTDSFTVLSFFEGKKYTYIAHLGGTTSGSMDLLDVEDTTEPSGVEISFGIKESDIELAVESIYRCTHFWSQKPKLKGITDYEIPTIYQNQGFAKESFFFLPTLPIWFQGRFEKHQKETPKEHVDNNSVFAVIDGICYDVSKVIAFELTNSFQGNIFLNFKTGEIQINANREEVVFNPETIALLEERTKQALGDIKETLLKKIQGTRTLKSLLRMTKDGHLLNQALKDSFSVTMTLQGRELTVRHEGRGNYSLILPDNDLFCTPNFTQSTRTIPLSFDNIKPILPRPMTEDEQKLIRNFYNEYEFGGVAKISLRSVAVVYTRCPEWYSELAPSKEKVESITSALENYKNILKKRTRLKKETMEVQIKDLIEKAVKGIKQKPPKKGYRLQTMFSTIGISLQTFEIEEVEDNGNTLFLVEDQKRSTYEMKNDKDLFARTYYGEKILKKNVVLIPKEVAKKLKNAKDLEVLWEKKDMKAYKGELEAICYNRHTPGFLKELRPYQNLLKNYWSQEESPLFEKFFNHLEQKLDNERRQGLEMVFEAEISSLSMVVKNNLRLLESWIEKNSFLRVLNYRLDLQEEMKTLLEKYNQD